MSLESSFKRTYEVIVAIKFQLRGAAQKKFYRTINVKPRREKPWQELF